MAAFTPAPEPVADPAPRASVLLACADPAALARFYGDLLPVVPQPGLSASHWRLPLPGGGLLELYAPSRRRPLPPAGGRMALGLRRIGDGQTLAAWLRDASALGAALEEGPRQEPFGWEAWLRDPEGNRVLLLVVPG
ncbi:MAG: VOC family protein [Vulcanococcus sp.]|jgi:catechol-2,3-dioxygenase